MEKWTAFDRKFNSEDSYALVYDDGSHAQFLPGSSKHFFDLEKYKTDIGKDFKRITMYLCTSSDLEMCENPSKDDDDKEADIQEVWDEFDNMQDTEQGMNSDISVEVMQQIEEDKQIAQIIQNQLCDDELSEVNVKCTDDIYKIAQSKVDAGQQFKITTRRNTPLSRRLLLWQRETKKSSPTSQLSIHFIAEDGIDSGALRKEFLENTMQEIKTCMFPNGTVPFIQHTMYKMEIFAHVEKLWPLQSHKMAQRPVSLSHVHLTLSGNKLIFSTYKIKI